MHAGALEEWSTDVTSEAISVVPWSVQPPVTCTVHLYDTVYGR